MDQELADLDLPLADPHQARRLVHVGAAPALGEVVGDVRLHRPAQGLPLGGLELVHDPVGDLLVGGRQDGVIDLPRLAHEVVQPVRGDRSGGLADRDLVQRLADRGRQRGRRHEPPVASLRLPRGEGRYDLRQRLAGPQPAAGRLGRRGVGGDDRLDVEEGAVHPGSRLLGEALESQIDRSEVAHRPAGDGRGPEAPAHHRLGGRAMQPQVGIGTAQRSRPLRRPVRRDLDQELHARLADEARAARLLGVLGMHLQQRLRRDDAVDRGTPLALVLVGGGRSDPGPG